jgi:hypothetical protein
MEHTVVTSKQVKQRLGTLILDMKYKPEDIILIEKVGSDEYVGVLCNPQVLCDAGIEIPAKAKPDAKAKSEEKADKKKK